MDHLSIDIETRSSVDITKAGLYKYAQSPDFQVLLFAYQWNDKPVMIKDLANGEQIPALIQAALMDLMFCHNILLTVVFEQFPLCGIVPRLVPGPSPVGLRRFARDTEVPDQRLAGRQLLLILW